MTLGTQNLRDQITTRLAASPTGLACCQLEGAQTILNAASVTCVANLAALPNAADNQGRFFFVQDISAYRFSDGVTWTNSVASEKVVVGSTLWTWGRNNYGRLGRSTGYACSPGTTTGGGTNWCSVGSGYFHSAAVKTDGTLWTWGAAWGGVLGNGTTISRSSPGQTCGLGTNWCEASVGQFQSVAVKTDGTLWTWGDNTSGKLGDGTVTGRCSPGTTAGGGTNWCQASTGWFHTAAVKCDGTLWTWGSNRCTFSISINDCVAGMLGTDSCVDRSSPGQTCGLGTTWCEVSAGRGHTQAVKTDGTLWTWGTNMVSQLGRTGGYFSLSPGTIFGGGTTWCQTSAGCVTGAAVKIDGTLWTWGANNGGELGSGVMGPSVASRISPGATAGGGTTWCKVSFGCGYATAIKTDGTVWGWGGNSQGQLGDGTTTLRCSPVTPAGGGTTWCTVSRGAALQFVYKGFNIPT